MTFPWRLAGILGARGAAYELLRAVARWSGRYLNPMVRASWRRASLILVQNEETKCWLPRRYQAKATVFPHDVLEQLPLGGRQDGRPVMLFAGRLLAWKGVSLAIRSLEHLPGWHLIVCGEGPDLKRLRRQTERRGLSSRVEFRGWVERDALLRTMRTEASVFVFPSLHDDAPWVVVEAMACGLPVVALNRGGPPVLAGSRTMVEPSNPCATSKRFAHRVLEMTEADSQASRERADEFLEAARLAQLKLLLARTSIWPCPNSRAMESRIAP